MLASEAAATESANQDLVEVVDSLSTTTHIPHIVISALIALGVFIAAKIIVNVVRKALKKFSARSTKFTPMMASLVSKIVSVVVWIIAIVAMLGAFGIDLTPVLAGLGITGVVLGFALQESISSFFSGIMIAINGPFRVGDWVDIGTVSGEVESMDLMCVTLAAGDNRKITMNNKTVWGSTIVNYSYIDKRRIDMSVSIRYTDDVEKAKKIIRELLASYKEVFKDPAPAVEINEFGASAISICVRPWVCPEDYWTVYYRFNSDILPLMQKNGIDMPFDQITVHVEGTGSKEN